ARAWAREEFEGRPKVRARAVRLLDEVLNRDGNRPELRRLTVKLALEQYNLKLARGHLEKLLPWEELQRAAKEEVRDKARAELEGYWAQLLEAEKKPAEAMDCCRRAIRHDPEGQDNYVRLAWLLRRQKEDETERRERLLREHRDEAMHHLDGGLALRQKQGKREGGDPARFQLLWHKAGLLLDELKGLDAEEKPAAGAEERKRALEAQVAETIEQVRKDRQLPAAADFLQARLLAQDRKSGV